MEKYHTAKRQQSAVYHLCNKKALFGDSALADFLMSVLFSEQTPKSSLPRPQGSHLLLFHFPTFQCLTCFPTVAS